MAKNSDKSLVIVESPAKAKTLSKFLGSSFTILPSYGHIVDLPEKNMGVDIEDNFKPTYVVLKEKQKILSEIKKQAKDKQKIYLATDPDREGEAIGWHIKNKLLEEKTGRAKAKNKKAATSKKAGDDKQFLRVEFHEITKSAVEDAFKHPRDIDVNLIEAQQGRRILDRIVGYLLSPLLWRKIARGLSAGRVQSVALRLVVEREREIIAFKAQEYWDIEAEFKKADTSFTAKLERIEDKKAEIKNKEEAEGLVEAIKSEVFTVEDIKETEKKRNPLPPFITSTLQQEAFNKLGFNANKTMSLAQALYEGIDFPDGPLGLITYMRTDSPKAADSAINEVRGFINKEFGKDYLPQAPNYYKPKKSAQEAHEAIRPTSVLRKPKDIELFLDNDLFRLYELIWKRFAASQMKPAVYLQTSIDIKGGQFIFRASASRMLFAGCSVLYITDDENGQSKVLPDLIKGEKLDLVNLTPAQHFTKAPPRFSDASLVRALEEDGIGRPSTYAPTLQTLVYRDYARRISGYFHPTELGMKVIDLLVAYFANIVNVEFTAKIEESLDEVEEGKINYAEILKDFYTPFKADLDFAQANIKKEVIYTDEVCSLCGKPMVIKWGRAGKFLSCSAFPECRFAKSITTGIKCPQDNCSGELIERRGRRGRFFYGCSNYPKCTFTSNKLPANLKQ
ncbi:MAG: type I DNA topoisomerase [Candidatus Omnitrophota bacterium]